MLGGFFNRRHLISRRVFQERVGQTESIGLTLGLCVNFSLSYQKTDTQLYPVVLSLALADLKLTNEK